MEFYEQYVGLGVIVAIALTLGFAFPLLSRILGPFRPDKHEAKLTPYESGQDPVGSARDRFSVKFYMVAMLFILFDIEVIFMYPWAVQFEELTAALGWIPLVSMTTFIGSLMVGLIYLYKKGGLNWS